MGAQCTMQVLGRPLENRPLATKVFGHNRQGSKEQASKGTMKLFGMITKTTESPAACSNIIMKHSQMNFHSICIMVPRNKSDSYNQSIETSYLNICCRWHQNELAATDCICQVPVAKNVMASYYAQASASH